MRLLLVFALSISLSAKTQTVIDYANYTASGCVFNISTDVPARLNNTDFTVKHQTSVGEVDYGSSTQVIYFAGNSSGSTGSEYKIQYSFQLNYSYSIAQTYNGEKAVRKKLYKRGIFGVPTLLITRLCCFYASLFR